MCNVIRLVRSFLFLQVIAVSTLFPLQAFSAPLTTVSPWMGTYREAQNATLTCTDATGLGCATTYYCLGTGCAPTTVYSGPINIASSTTLRFYSIDVANNSEEVRDYNYTIDPSLAYRFERLMPQLAQPWYFDRPTGMAVDTNGNIYVADTYNYRIQKFDSSGAFVTTWGSIGDGNGQFIAPDSLAVDLAGNVYVSDTFNNRIQKFTSSGAFVTAWGSYGNGNGQFYYPRGITVDSAGNVYVVDCYNNRIQKFTSSGQFVTAWGSYGSSNGQFGYPLGITLDSTGNIYVADFGNNRIQKFTSSGQFVTAWGSLGSGDGQFSYPQGISVDSAGNVYIADTSNNRIQKFTSSGVFVTSWGSQGCSNGQFKIPIGITVDSIGNAYVTDNNRIQKFTSSGAFVTAWGSQGCGNGQFEYPNGITVDSAGNAYVTDATNNSIQKFDFSGAFVTAWGSYGSDNGQFNNPNGITVDLSGNVYVIDYYNNRIQKFTSSGQFVTAWGSQGSGNGQFSYPQGINVDSVGNVYVVDSNNYRIQKFTSSGIFVTAWGSQGSSYGQFKNPNAIAVDSSGNVYVVDSNNYRIQKFTSSGTFIAAWGSQGNGNGQFSYPQGINVDSSGNIYVADAGSKNRIQKFTSSGTFVTAWGTQGSGNGQFESPTGISVDSAGNVYVVDTVNHRIQKFSNPFLPGAPTGVSATASNDQATVGFTPPASDGGIPISSYTVTSNPGNITATGTASPITVTGLTYGTSYSFVVTATNAAGAGPASIPSNNVTLADTTPPTTTASPSGGTYSGVQNVTLSCNDGIGSGCTSTYYCLGTGCTPTTPYSGVIAITNSTDLRFYSTDLAGNSEGITTSTYVLVSPVTPPTIRVPADKPTIQGAIDAAANGDTVLVSPGTYTENINFKGKAITVKSMAGPDTTIIDGNRAGSVVIFASGESNSSVLDGFTIRNGKPSGSISPYDGGGIYISNTSPMISNNKIIDNIGCTGPGIYAANSSAIIQGNAIINNVRSGCTGGTGGGGIYLGGAGSAQILDNEISNNSVALGGNGGGIGMNSAGTPLIRGNIIRGNSAGGITPCATGGGINMINTNNATIVQNVIAGNSAGCGGGVYWMVPSGARGPYLVNNTVVENDASTGSGLYADGYDANALLINNIIVGKSGQAAVYCGNFNDLNPPQFRNNTIYSPSGNSFGGICSDPNGVNGNITADPLLYNSGTGKYYPVFGSPAIDAGDNGAPSLPVTDMDGRPRILDGNHDGVATVDMGAFEFDPTLPVAVIVGAPSGFTNSTTVTLTIGGSQVVTYRYAVDNGPFTTTETAVTTPISLASLSETKHSVAVIGKDATGSWQVVPTIVSWTVDATPPTTTSAPGAGVYAAPQSISLSCSGGTGSGCAAIYYCIGVGCTPAIPYSGAITVSSSTDLRYYSRDLAGNSEGVKTATYSINPTYTLTVSDSGMGSGTVTGTNISCTTGSTTGCSAAFDSGTAVTLTATATSGSAFTGWSGACSAISGNQCSVIMDSAKSVTATFVVLPPVTTITINPSLPNGANGWYVTTPTINLASNKPGTTYYQWSTLSGYDFSTQAQTWVSGGTALNIRGDDTGNWYNLPFGFSFYGTTYTRVYVSSNGLMRFDAADSAYSNSGAGIATKVAIAPLWDDLMTNQRVGDDIYVFQPDPDSVGFRWQAVTYSGSHDTNFEAILYRDGHIRFNYGVQAGGLTPTIGISKGDGVTYQLAYDNNLSTTNNFQSILYTPSGWNTNTGNITAPDGNNTFEYYSVDTLGNSEGVQSRNIKVDRATPVTAASPVAGTYTFPLNVILSCNDGAGSGCGATFYCLGTGCTPTTPYTGLIAISDPADLRYYSADVAGNSELVQTATYTMVPGACADPVSPGTTGQTGSSVNDLGEIVWSQSDPTGYQQIFSSVRGQLTSDTTQHMFPALNNRGDVVWEQNGQIYGLLSGQLTQLTMFNNGHQPSINDFGEVVWSQFDPTTGHNQIYSITRGYLTTDQNEHFNPSINSRGDLVWEQPDPTNGLNQIYGIINGIPSQITNNPAWHSQPSISNSGEVVWVQSQWQGTPDGRIYSSTRGQVTHDCPLGFGHSEPSVNSCGDLTFTNSGSNGPAIYRLGNNAPCANDPEPNNSRQQAVAVGGNSTTTGTLDSVADMEDWYSFTANAGDAIKVNVNWTATAPNMLIVELQNNNGQMLMSFPGPMNPIVLNTVAPYTGTYYVHLMAPSGRFGYNLSLNVLHAPTIGLNPVATPTNQSTQLISGSREAGSVITATGSTSVVFGQVAYPTETTWSFTVSSLTEGDNNISITATNIAGLKGSVSATITLDTMAPTVSIVSPVAGISNKKIQQLIYSASDGTVVVTLDGSVITGPSIDNLTDGPHTLIVEATDAATNKGSATVNFTIDTVAPAVGINPVTTPTNLLSQTLTGTREAGSIIAATVNTSAAIGVITYPSDTTWSVAVSNLAEGSNVITITATDSAGNKGTTTPVTITLDTLVPAVSIASPVAGISNQKSQLLTYTVSDGTVVVTLDGSIINVSSGQMLDNLSDGTHTITVQATDAAGNKGSASVGFTVDTVAPAVAINPVTSPTNQTNQTITGTREALAVITATVNTSATVGSVTYPTDTTWSIAVGNLAEGNNTIAVTATDAAGNKGSSSTTITLDTVAPKVSISSPVAGISNQKSQQLIYTVSDGTVVVTLDGTVITGSSLDNLADGPHTITVGVTDAAGNKGTATVNFTIDTVAPAVGINPVTTPTNQASQTLTGTREAGAAINANVNTSAAIGIITYPSDTTWSVAVSNLAEGSNTINITATDSAGNKGTAPVTITLDTLAPAVSIASPIAGISNQKSQPLTYTVSDGNVVVTLDGSIINVSSGQMLDNLGDGTHTITVQATDAAGNKGSASVSFSVDTVAPAVAINPVTSPTNQTGQAITGTREALAVITATVNTSATLGPVTYPTDTTWSIAVSNLAEGNNTIAVTATDAAGNKGSSSATITLDTVAPKVSISSPVAGISNQKSQQLIYTVSDGTVVVTLDGTVITGSNLDNLADGPHTVTVGVTDAAGNKGIATVNFTIDTVAPAVGINPVTTPTNQLSQTLTGTREAGAAITANVNTSAVLSSVTYPSDTSWSVAVSNLVEGSNIISVTATDSAGNKGTAPVTITVDTLAPAVSIGSPVAGISNQKSQPLNYTVSDGTVVVTLDGSIINVSSGQMLDNLSDGTHTITVQATDAAGNKGSASVSFSVDTVAPAVAMNPVVSPTNLTSQTVTGTREAGVAIAVAVSSSATVGSITYPTATTWGCSISGLVNGVNTVTVTATDAAGNKGSATVSFTVDTVAPAVAINPVTSPTNQSSQMFSGSREANATIVAAVNTTATVGAVSYPTSTSWSCTVGGLTEGNNALTVTASDAAGNSSIATAAVTYDSVAPTVSISSPFGITNNNNPLLIFAVSDGTIVVKLDGAVVAKNSGDAIGPLADGAHIVRVAATDAAGNIGSAEISFTVDTLPPSISINAVTTPTKITSQTITGVMENGASVAVAVNTAAMVESITYPSATTWSCTITNLVYGVNNITATARDAAGNMASATTSILERTH